MAELTDADRLVMASAIGAAMSAAYGPAAVSLSGPLAVAMQTLESIGVLASPVASVMTEAENIADEAAIRQNERERLIKAVEAEGRDTMTTDEVLEILSRSAS